MTSPDPIAPIIYLASPYTHTDASVREARFHQATRAAATLIESGAVVYSPITMTHPIDLLLAEDGATLGSEYWVKFDEAFMNACSKMVILRIDGWSESLGIKREIEFFRAMEKPIEFLDP